MIVPVYLESSIKPKLYDPGAFFFKSTVKRGVERDDLAFSKNVDCFVGSTSGNWEPLTFCSSSDDDEIIVSLSPHSPVLMVRNERPNKPSLSTSRRN